MERSDLIKIVITAVVTLVLKEFLSWFIKTTKVFAVKIKTATIPWLKSNPQVFDLILQGLACAFFFWMTFIDVKPGPVTHDYVKATVLLAGVFFFELAQFVKKAEAFAIRQGDIAASKIIAKRKAEAEARTRPQ